MKLTNKYNAPAWMVHLARPFNPPPAGTIRVTELIKSPRYVQLYRRHFDDLEEDVSDRVYMVLGTLFHHAAQMAGEAIGDDVLIEERLRYEVDGWILTGRPDEYHADGTLIDHKYTGAFSYIKGVKPEYCAQLQVYARMFQVLGFKVERLINQYVFRDWMKRKFRLNPAEYPPPYKTAEHPIWPVEKANVYIAERISAHKAAQDLPDSDLPDCTPEERWFRGNVWAIMRDEIDQWAVVKTGRKRAIRVFDNESEAYSLVSRFAGSRVEHRPGSRAKIALKLCDTESEAKALMISRGGTRIEFRPGVSEFCTICVCRPFCNQAAKLGLNDEGGDEE